MAKPTPQPVPLPKPRRFMNQAEVEQTWNTRTWREYMLNRRRSRRSREERKARAERLTEKQRRKLLYAEHLAGEG